MEALEKVMLSGWTPGGVGIWVLVGTVLIGFWKGLPAVLDAWSNSIEKEKQHREREIERLERQIREGDERHEECLKGQALLREEVMRLQREMSAMVLQMRQMQLSAVGLVKSTAEERAPSPLGDLLAQAFPIEGGKQ